MSTAASKKRRYKQLKEEGICPRCKVSPPEPNRVQCAGCAKVTRERGRKLSTQLKREIVEAYGGSCGCCGETQIEFLTIDHINGRGNRDSPELKAKSARLYCILKSLGFPKDNFRLLCSNCNSSLGNYGYCPHETN